MIYYLLSVIWLIYLLFYINTWGCMKVSSGKWFISRKFKKSYRHRISLSYNFLFFWKLKQDILGYFCHFSGQIPERKYCRGRKKSFGSRFSEHSPSGQGRQQATCSQLGRSGHRSKNASIFLAFFFFLFLFILARTPVCGTVLLHSEWVFLPQFNFSETPHRCAQMCLLGDSKFSQVGNKC